MPIIIADAGPFIALARIDQLYLLPALFGEVVVTNAIETELLIGVFTETVRVKAASQLLGASSSQGRGDSRAKYQAGEH